MNREAILMRFVFFTLLFIPRGPRKETLIPYIYNASNKYLPKNLREKLKIEIPAIMGTKTSFDVLITDIRPTAKL